MSECVYVRVADGTTHLQRAVREACVVAPEKNRREAERAAHQRDIGGRKEWRHVGVHVELVQHPTVLLRVGGGGGEDGERGELVLFVLRAEEGVQNLKSLRLAQYELHGG